MISYYTKNAFKLFMFSLTILFLLIPIVQYPKVSVKVDNIKQNQDSDVLTITCNLNADEYVVADSLVASTLPFEQYISISFDAQPDELFIPKRTQPLLVLHGEKIIKFTVPAGSKLIEQIILSYETYDINKKTFSGISTIVIPTQKNNQQEQPDEKLQEIIQDSHNQFGDEEVAKISGQDENIAGVLEKNNNSLVVGDEMHKDIVNGQQEQNDSYDANDQNNNDENIAGQSLSFSESLINYMQKSNSIILLCIIVFLIGLLMSFTPCMYPMIPITLGVLAIDKTKTKKDAFIKATAYILGIAFTFVILGLLAISGKMVFGSLLAKPWFIALLLVFFGYLIGSMLGFYDISLAAMQINIVSESSLIGPFLYGLASGTVTSPCVSPGLFALLTFVAEQGSYIYGSLLLLLFGLGLGFPLWVIAVFFNGWEALPRSGVWMLEIKKLIGFILVFIWRSYAILLFSSWIVNIFLCFVVLIYGLFTLYNALIIYAYNKIYKYYLLLVFVLSLCLSGFFIYIAYTSLVFNSSSQKNYDHYWHDNISDALALAKEKNKKVLVDCTASWCSLCKAVDKKFFSSELFWKNVDDYVVAVKLDCSNIENAQAQNFLDEYNIRGLPAILILDPNTLEIWGQFDSRVCNWDIMMLTKSIVDMCKETEDKN